MGPSTYVASGYHLILPPFSMRIGFPLSKTEPRFAVIGVSAEPELKDQIVS
jgi:hypothetical protein